MRDEHQRWLDKVNKTEDCWLWTGTTYRGGYGHFRRKIEGRWVMYKAHRYAIEYFGKKYIPEGMFVCHSCDNPSCVNPDHLFLGSAKENTQDCIKKGRQRHGVCKTKHAVTEEEVCQIRKMRGIGLKMKDISDIVGVSVPQVSRIVNHITHSSVSAAGG